ncbi:MAG: hypothetical protein ABII76_14155 [Pseudomonadota bacterium]
MSKKKTLDQRLQELDELREELIGQRARMTDREKIGMLEDAQPRILHATPEMETLLSTGYKMNLDTAKRIIEERDKNPQTWPLERYEQAQAFIQAYNATTREPSSDRAGWVRTRA